MQSPHFDSTTYQGTLYAGSAPSGFDPGTIKLHHASGYPGEPDATCYSNYVSSGLQGMQGYHGGREPPSYGDTASFFHSSIVPGFSNGNYYKMPSRQMELTDYTSTANMMSRCQDSFLMKPVDAMTMTDSSEIFGSGNTHEDPHQHLHQQNQHLHHHQHHLHHASHHNTFIEPSENSDLSKLGQDSNSIFGHHPVKLEPFKTEPPHSLSEYDKSLHPLPTTANTTSSTTTPTSTFSQTLRHDNNEKSPSLHISTKGEQSSKQNSPLFTDSKPISGSTSLTGNTGDETPQQNKAYEEKKTDAEALDASGECKPTMSYIALIAKAILESEQRRLNLGSIYGWIEKHYPFYKNKGQGWRNSVRHNLSLNDCFIKAGRCEDGKGNYWAIHPANIQDFMRGDFRQRRRSRRRGRKKECDLSMYHVANGYLPSTGSPLASNMAFNSTALSSIYSPYTDAERRAYRLDEALLRQSMSNPFVKWYQHGVSSPGYGASTSPPTGGTGVYPNTSPAPWGPHHQAYPESNTQPLYPVLNSTFPR